MNRIFGVLFLFILLGLPQHAVAKCYTQAEAEAEAAIRIHSEIMVTALTCQYSASGQSLTEMYVAFGKRNNQRLRDAEKTLISYHKKKSGAGIEGLDRLRTVLGNEYAERIAARDPVRVCPQLGNSVVGAAQWTPAQLQAAIARAAETGTTVPLCVQQAKASKTISKTK